MTLFEIMTSLSNILSLADSRIGSLQIQVASRNNHVQLADFIESEFLGEQVEAINKLSEYVAQLRRISKGHGCQVPRLFQQMVSCM
uniref:Ferritin-3, chloroplastic n=1 Tax=Tanacetum cinerariifolium TaxID=118510 RepID=A0A6L2NSH6_TANCI|nr:ferritin-3, chloroplastic [Tanacetum cinerariifolium]